MVLAVKLECYSLRLRRALVIKTSTESVVSSNEPSGWHVRV